MGRGVKLGPIAQRQSRRLIISWSGVRIPVGPRVVLKNRALGRTDGPKRGAGKEFPRVSGVTVPADLLRKSKSGDAIGARSPFGERRVERGATGPGFESLWAQEIQIIE